MTQDKTPELKALQYWRENQGKLSTYYAGAYTGIPFDVQRIVENLLSRAAEAQEQKGETIDTFKLPFDVQLGNNTFGKGVSFKTYADAANRYYGYAIEKTTPEPQGAEILLNALSVAKRDIRNWFTSKEAMESAILAIDDAISDFKGE